MLPMLAEALNGHALVPDGREQIPAGVGGPRCASAAAVAGEDGGGDSSGPSLAGLDGPLRAAAAPPRRRRCRLRLRRAAAAAAAVWFAPALAGSEACAAPKHPTLP